jgi:hypothetical protein
MTPAMSGQHRLIATFDEMARAREAILALERVGIEGSNVTLGSADRGRPPVEPTDTRGRDRRLGGDVGHRVGLGALLGTVAGAILGLAVGLLAFSGAGVWASTIGAGIAGGAAGGVLGGVSGLGTSGAWQRTYAEVPEDHVVVGVHHTDREIVDDAEHTLREHGPDELERYDPEGWRIS